MRKAFRILLCFLGLLALGEIADLAWLGHVRATVNAANISVTIGGNGSITSFTFPFIGVAPSDVTVVYTDANGNQTTLVQNTQYTITLNAPPVGSVWGIGGTVTYPLVGSPIASGTTLTIYRSLPLQQTVSSNQGQAFPLAVETGMDLLEMQVQQVNNLLGRALLQPITDTCTLSPMPGQIQRANNVLGFDSTGCIPVALSTLPAAFVSAAMQPVVENPTLVGARAAMGIVTTPSTTTTGHIATWGDAAGGSLLDGGAPPSPTAGRIRLTGATTFYADRTNGTDVTGCGLAASTAACQSIPYVAAILQNNYDFAGQAVTISAADSGSTYAPFLITGPWPGGSFVTIVGDIATPDNVTIDGGTANYCAGAQYGGSVIVEGFRLQNCANEISSTDVFTTVLFADIDFAAPTAGGNSIYCSRYGYCEAIGGGNLISGIGGNFFQVSHQGNFRAAEAGTGTAAFKLTANLTLSSGSFAYASSLGDITFTQYTASPFNLNGFTVTGERWQVDSGGLIQALNNSTGASMTPTFFPGTTAGHCVGDCEIDQVAHTPATTVSCGTGSSVVGNDYYGYVVTGSTATTSCVVVFASAFSIAPYCQVTWALGTVPTFSVFDATTSLGVNYSSQTGGSFVYFCKGA